MTLCLNENWIPLNLGRTETWETYIVPVVLVGRIIFSYNGILIKVSTGLSLVVLAILYAEHC